MFSAAQQRHKYFQKIDPVPRTLHTYYQRRSGAGAGLSSLHHITHLFHCLVMSNVYCVLCSLKSTCVLVLNTRQQRGGPLVCSVHGYKSVLFT